MLRTASLLPVCVPRTSHSLSYRTCSLTEWIESREHLPIEYVDHLLSFGAVYVNGRRKTTDCVLAIGDWVRIHREPKRFPHLCAREYLERIVEEDTNFLIVDKPPGIPVHETLDNCVENVKTQLEQVVQQRLWVTHRLDTLTSGYLVFAKHAVAARRFHESLLRREVRKFYAARVEYPVSCGEYVHYMTPSSGGPKVLSKDPFPGCKPCVLRVLGCTEEGGGWRINMELLTGRTHQIRAQMGALGAPLIGDILYGSRQLGIPYLRCTGLISAYLRVGTCQGG